MDLFAFKTVCPYCGAGHRRNKEGICPACKKRYLLAKPIRRRSSKKSLREFNEKLKNVKNDIADFLGHTNSRQKQLLAGMVAIMTLVFVLFVTAAINLSTLDADEYVAPERSCIPVMYYSGNTAYCLFKDGKTVELGVGEIKKFDISSNGDIMYILFSGRITADVDSAKEGDYVVRIDNGKSLEIVAKGDIGKVSYLTGGNCEHLYFAVPSGDGARVGENKEKQQNVDEEILAAMERYSNLENASDASDSFTSLDDDSLSDENSDEVSESTVKASVASFSKLGDYTLYYSHRRGVGRVIAQNVKSLDMAVSPNGRYLVYCAADSEGSQLMKYRLSKKSSSGMGIKNARALSIDNKGKYFTFVKTTPQGVTELSYCKNVEDKQTLSLPESRAQEIVFSADMHSFAVRFEDYTVFKSSSDSAFRTVDFDTTSDFGYKRNVYAKTVFMTENDIALSFSVSEGDLFPFFYYDAAGRTIYRVSENGAKSPYLDVAIEDAAVSDNGTLVYVSGGTLYTGKLSTGKNVKRLVTENFEYELYDISPDGKTLFINDKSEKIFTVPINSGDFSAPEMLTENASFVRLSPDSKMLFYSKGNEAYLKRSAGNARLTDNGIIPDYTCVFTSDFSQFVYAKNMGTDVNGNAKVSLYIYREGKPMFVTENLTNFITVDGAGFADSRSNNIFPTEKEEGNSSANGTMIIG